MALVPVETVPDCNVLSVMMVSQLLCFLFLTTTNGKVGLAVPTIFCKLRSQAFQLTHGNIGYFSFSKQMALWHS
jgi:hypothetical protein